MAHLFQVGYSTKFDPDTGNINRGVGLPAVQFIVDELGGKIQVDSQPGQGALFTVTLPLAAI
jgi:two-component system sensor histidine kinase YcbA